MLKASNSITVSALATSTGFRFKKLKLDLHFKLECSTELSYMSVVVGELGVEAPIEEGLMTVLPDLSLRVAGWARGEDDVRVRFISRP